MKKVCGLTSSKFDAFGVSGDPLFRQIAHRRHSYPCRNYIDVCRLCRLAISSYFYCATLRPNHRYRPNPDPLLKGVAAVVSVLLGCDRVGQQSPPGSHVQNRPCIWQANRWAKQGALLQDQVVEAAPAASLWSGWPERGST